MTRSVIAVILATGLMVGFDCVSRARPEVTFTDSPARIGAAIDFCQVLPSLGARRGYGNFSLKYLFDVDYSGQPVNIRTISAPSVDEKEMLKCMQSWRFYGVSKSRNVFALFHWTHGTGWDYLFIIGQKFKYKITISGDRSPYCGSGGN